MKKILFILLFCIWQSASFGQTEGFVTSNNATIYYRTYDAVGKTVLIINGGPGMNSNGFENVAKRLAQQCKTILYDQRGTGKSTVTVLDSKSITMKLMVEDLECLRRKLKIKKWILLGHSFGGILASYYASIYPHRIESLILSSSGGLDLELLNYLPARINSLLNAQETDSLAYWRNKIRDGDTTYFAKLRMGTALAPAYVYKREYIPLVADRLTQLNTQINGLIWSDLNRINYDCKQKLAAFKKPVLIIQGKQDIIEEKTALTEHAVFKNSKLVMLDNCGHYGWIDRADDYYKEIEEFINSK